MTRQEAAGRDVVLIHSTGQGAAGWERVVRALGERGRTAHAVELMSGPGLLAADHAEHIRRQVGAVAAPVVLAYSGSGPLLVGVTNARDVDTGRAARQPPRRKGTF